MAYREVTMLEVKGVLRLWLTGVRKKRIAARLGLNVKTVRRYLRADVRLSKIRTLLRRQGVMISYPTLRRFALGELGWGRTAPTIPLADCGPGEEVQLDTGWMTHLAPDTQGRGRRFRAWIFTPVLSRYRFVSPVFREMTDTASYESE